MEFLVLLPLLLATAVVPLVVHRSVIPFNGNKHEAFFGYEFTTDFFFWNKSYLVLICGILGTSALIFSYKKVKPLWKFKFLPTALVLLALFVILSATFSPYQDTVWKGFAGSYESTFSYLSYFILCYLSFCVLEKKGNIDTFNIILGMSALLIALIGFAEYFGIYILNLSPLKWLIWGDTSVYSYFDYTDTGIISSTIGNSNNVGSYAVLLFPYSIALFLFALTAISTVLAGVFNFFMFILLVGSHSRAAYLGAFVSLLLTSYFLLPQVRTKWKSVRFLFIAELLVLVLMLFHSRHFEEAEKKTMRDFSRDNDYSVAGRISATGVDDPLRNLEIRNGVLVLTTKNTGLVLVPQAEGFLVKDLENNPVPITVTDGLVHPLKKDLLNFRFKLVNENAGRLIVIRHPNFEISVLSTSAGFKIAERNLFREPVEPEKVNLGISDQAGSGRVYIWSRTLPLLKGLWFLGRGPGAFAFDFPQNDYNGKLTTFGSHELLVEKPHSGYLQFTHAFGFTALLIFLSLLLVYFVQTLILLKKATYLNGNQLALFAAITGFAIVLIFNDSNVAIAPLFWVFLGLGYAINKNSTGNSYCQN